MGYWSATQQVGFLASLPSFILLLAIGHFFPGPPGGTVLAGKVIFYILITLVPSAIGWGFMFFSSFNGLSPITEAIILSLQSLFFVISLFFISKLEPLLPSQMLGMRKVHKSISLTFITLLFLPTLGITINQFIDPKGSASKGEYTFVKYNRYPCKSNLGQGNQEDSGRTCKIHNICDGDSKSEACLCEIDPNSKACKTAKANNICKTSGKESEACIDATKAIEGFNGNVSGSGNGSVYENGRNIDIGMYNFYQHAQNTKRTKNLIFGN